MFASLVLSSLLMVMPVFGQDKPAAPPPGSWGGLIPMMLVMFLIIYFLMIRPEQKKQKDRQNLVNNLKKGDKIVTLGGMMGIVHNVKDNTVMVKIADNTVVEYTKTAISTVLKEGNEKTQKIEAVTEEKKESKDSKEKKK
jgi:preprotein translocase subunit YajC